MSKELNLFEEEVEVLPPGSLEEGELIRLLDKIKSNAATSAKEQELRDEVKQVIEAVLFASSEPISFKKLREVTDSVHTFPPRTLMGLIKELRDEYDERKKPYQIDEIGNGLVLRTRPSYGEYIRLLYRNKRLEKLSQAATEVLAIIAYRQPITRAKVEAIRGVDSSGIMLTLQERGLIEVVGRLDAPGRPSLWATTPAFLSHFGLRGLDHLPKLGDKAQEADEKVQEFLSQPKIKPSQAVEASPLPNPV
ncbi:MAG: SMC-Scp complex subunit ScpB [Waddliaceae bacterium]|nr:SMC-Scp complex subunit ScpB [Waddliaceae bacterium]